VLLEPLVDQLRGVIAEGYLVPGAVERGLAAHRRLYKCIRAKNAEGAFQTIMAHLQDSEARVQGASKP
jgi:DNA-binding FadR family transcriptional regulator